MKSTVILLGESGWERRGGWLAGSLVFNEWKTKKGKISGPIRLVFYLVLPHFLKTSNIPAIICKDSFYRVLFFF